MNSDSNSWTYLYFGLKTKKPRKVKMFSMSIFDLNKTWNFSSLYLLWRHLTQWHQSKNQCVEKYCFCYKRSYVNDVYMEGEWVKYLENYHVLFGFMFINSFLWTEWLGGLAKLIIFCGHQKSMTPKVCKFQVYRVQILTMLCRKNCN